MQRTLAIPAVAIALLIVIGVTAMAVARGSSHHTATSPHPTATRAVPTSTATSRKVVRPRTSQPTATAIPTATAPPTATATTSVAEEATLTPTPPATAKPRPTASPTSAAAQPLVVVLDPGHGGVMEYGDESGAVNGTLEEKNLTLAVAKAARGYLQKWGYRVFLTRTSDRHVNTPERDYNHDGKIDNVDEFDARTLFANRHHADVFLSIHFDGSTDPSFHGTHGYYCPDRPFWRSSERLATIVTQDVARSVTQAGHPDPDNGIATDVSDKIPQTRADYPWFLVLGPSRPHWLTGTAMPGALIESMYVSSPYDAAALRKPAIVDAVGRGYARGIRAYFHGRTTRLP